MKKLTLICLFISSIVFSQTVGQWKIYSDMKNTIESISSADEIWVVSKGGTFSYNSSENTYKTLTKADGLNSQSLSAVCIDGNNKIWFGSSEGYINIYDPSTGDVGRIMDIYNTGKTQKEITDLLYANDTIYAATDFGVSLINPSDYSFYDSYTKFGDFNSETPVISSYKNRLLYVITESGVAVQKSGAQNLSVPESWNSYAFGTAINAESASKILKYGLDILLASNNGVFRFNNSIWESFLLSGENVIDMFINGTTVYFLTQHTLYSYSGSTSVKLYEDSNQTFSSVQTSDGQSIYISTNKGLLKLNNGNTELIYPDGPLANSFMNMTIDSNGELWIATGKDNTGVGVMNFDGDSWKYFNTSTNPELQSNDFYNVSASGTSVFFANWGKGLTVYKESTFTTYNALNTSIVGISDDASFVSLSDVQADSKGNIWIANNSTASRKQLSVLTTDNNLYHYNVYSLSSVALGRMVIDQYDTKWFVATTGNTGLYYFNEEGTFSTTSDDVSDYISSTNGLITNDISGLAVDKRGQIWIGTSEGISLIQDPSRPKSTLTNSTAYSVRNQTITCIAVDPLDYKWIGTKQGVFVLSSDGYQLLNYYTNSNSPLPSNDIKSIAINPKDGVAYIGTDYGLAALNTSSVEPEESFSELFIYPNPFVLDGSDAVATIKGLIEDTTIKIIDVSGKSIRTFVTPGGKVATWDGKNDDGNYVASGVYIIVAYDEEADNVATAKIAVIKK
jgi:ligand-binding sensor domain-containing protein